MKLFYQILKISLFCVILSVISTSSGLYAQSTGLLFASHEVYQDKRTGLDLSPDKTLCFNGGFELSFDLSFTPKRLVYFGYLVRIIEDDKRNIDLVYNEETSHNHFNLIVGDRLSKAVFDMAPQTLYNRWNRIKIRLDVDNDRIIIDNGQIILIEKSVHLKKSACYKILFGTNNYKQFQTTDVPPMKLKNIAITQGKTVLYNWPLNQESGTMVNEVGQNNAAVINPVWISDTHKNWQSGPSLSINGAVSVAFNAKKEELYFVSPDTLFTYSLNGNKWTNIPYTTGKFEMSPGNQSIYDSFRQKLYNFSPDKQVVSIFDFEKQAWNNHGEVTKTTDFWQTNKFVSGIDSAIYMLGGYGHLVYKNRVQRYDLNSGIWDGEIKPKGDFYTPRYLAALGATPHGDTAYVLGGYGNNSGKQILNPRNIYDLMRFTVKDRTFKKIFELKATEQDFVFGNSLIVDSKNKSYYALMFPRHKYNSTLQLVKGSLTKPAYQLLGNTIPFSFHDTHSFADLYYGPESKQYVAVTLLRAENGPTNVAVFTLAGPPSAVETTVVSNQSSGWPYWVFAIVIISVPAAIYWLKKHKKTETKPVVIIDEEKPVMHIDQPVLADFQTQSQPEKVFVNTSPESSHDVLRKNAILLFGDLQVFDAEGSEITKHFTPLIRELFLVILLQSERWGRGLSSEKLNDILWYDKSAKSASNNRSVNIAKLKMLLDKMKYCQLSKETGSWKIDIDYNHIYFDYHEYLNIIKDQKNLTIDKIKSLSEITQQGNFLSNIEYEWLDTFKTQITNDVIDTYLHFAHSGVVKDPEFLSDLANYIFRFDPVNEEAMTIKCKALSMLGKHSLAKSTFENFTKEYRSIYGEEFKKDFHTVLDEA